METVAYGVSRSIPWTAPSQKTRTGYTSQFGFGVTTSGGQFQCQNTGRSAGAMDEPMSTLLGTPVDVLQIDVHGTIPAGRLTTS